MHVAGQLNKKIVASLTLFFFFFLDLVVSTTLVSSAELHPDISTALPAQIILVIIFVLGRVLFPVFGSVPRTKEDF